MCVVFVTVAARIFIGNMLTVDAVSLPGCSKGVDTSGQRQSGRSEPDKRFSPCCLVHPRCHHNMLMKQKAFKFCRAARVPLGKKDVDT